MPAFTNFATTLTYKDLDLLSDSFANYLVSSTSLKKGDRIAIQLPNILQFPIAVFGALKAGLIVVSTNPLYTEREMLHQFNDSGAKAVVILNTFAHKLEQIHTQTQIESIFVTDLGDILALPKRLLLRATMKSVKNAVPRHSLNAIDFRQILFKKNKSDFALPTIHIDDIAFLQYTGGTTGVAKGAMLSHANILANIEQFLLGTSQALIEGKEVVMTPLPLYHIYSLTVNCMAFTKLGCHMILVTDPRNLPAFIGLLKKYKPTAMSVVNTLALGLLNHPDFAGLDFSNLKATAAGGMALQKSVAERWLSVTHSPINEGYGLTETSPVASANPTDGSGKIGSIGLPVPSTVMKVIDESGHELDFDQPGELCIKGPQVMRGYWQAPEETARVLDAEGWFKTGDIASVDRDGYFKIIDRKKDMIVVSGFNVYPAEIEAVVLSHPMVLEAAAIGEKCEVSGERICLFVVKKEATLDSAALNKFCLENLTGYKRPHKIEFVRELPKNSVGKILKREMRTSV